MNRRTSVRRLLGAAGVAVGLVALLPSVAQAAAPIHANFSGTFYDVDFCGILVTLTNRGVDNYTPVLDSNGNVLSYRDTYQYNSTLTAANGKSVGLSAAGLTLVHVTRNLDGTQTVVFSLKGLPERISTTHGSILMRDAGIITFIDTFDSNGNQISETITQSGPHPAATGIFCDVITAALT